MTITGDAATITLADIPISHRSMSRPEHWQRATTTARLRDILSPRGHFAAASPACISHRRTFAITCALAALTDVDGSQQHLRAPDT